MKTLRQHNEDKNRERRRHDPSATGSAGVVCDTCRVEMVYSGHHFATSPPMSAVHCQNVNCDEHGFTKAMMS